MVQYNSLEYNSAEYIKVDNLTIKLNKKRT